MVAPVLPEPLAFSSVRIWDSLCRVFFFFTFQPNLIPLKWKLALTFLTLRNAYPSEMAVISCLYFHCVHYLIFCFYLCLPLDPSLSTSPKFRLSQEKKFLTNGCLICHWRIATKNKAFINQETHCASFGEVNKTADLGAAFKGRARNGKMLRVAPVKWSSSVYCLTK